MKKYYILLSEPDLSSLESKQVNKCIQDNWISSSGPFIEKFEKSFSFYLNRKFGIATSNGTSAIELALKALGVNNIKLLTNSGTPKLIGLEGYGLKILKTVPIKKYE